MSSIKQQLLRWVRQWHQRIVLIFCIPLLISATTGLAYRLGRSWLGLSKDFGRAMMTLHEGRYLGEGIVPIYVLVTGLGLLAILATGLVLLWGRPLPAAGRTRQVHHWVAALAILPLFITATTGIAYRLGRNWFGLSEEQAEIFMSLHQGNYWGEVGRPFYILILGLSLLVLIGTGATLLPRRLLRW